MTNNSYTPEITLARPLSPREKQCLTYLAQGLRVNELAAAIGIAPKTAEKQIASARLKLKAATREQAVATAICNNLIDLWPNL